MRDDEVVQSGGWSCNQHADAFADGETRARDATRSSKRPLDFHGNESNDLPFGIHTEYSEKTVFIK